MENSNENLPNQEVVLNSNEEKTKVAEASSDNGLSSFSELFQKSWNIFSGSIGKFLGIMIVPSLLVFLPFVFLGIIIFLFRGQFSDPLFFFICGLLIFAFVVLIIIVSIISKAGTYLLFKNIDKNPGIKETFFSAKKDAWPFFAITCIMAFFTILWSFIFIIPGILAAMRYSFAPWVYFFEGITGSKAIDRSKELVAGNFGWVFMNYLILFVGIMVISGIGSKMGSVVSFLVQIASMFMSIFIFIFSGFMYFDLVKKGAVKGS